MDLRRVPYYILTCGDKRRAHIEQVFNGLPCTIIDGITPGEIIRRYPQNRLLCGALGSAKAMLTAISAQPFVPFVFCEDDVSFTGENMLIDVPADADGIMLGHSAANLRFEEPYDGEKLLGEVVGANKRVYNMLSTHAILFLTLPYAVAHYGALVEAAAHCTHGANYGWDTYTARLQLKYKVYTLPAPHLYQDAAFGGQQEQTLVRELPHVEIDAHDKQRLTVNQKVSGLY